MDAYFYLKCPMRKAQCTMLMIWIAVAVITAQQPAGTAVAVDNDDICGSCMTCNQVGDKATRETPKDLGSFPSTKDAWLRRIQSGQSGADMVKMFNYLGTQRTVAMFADWTDRIAAGEVPPAP